tara:strand:- start:3315 stop:4199 length:885 start_codon:yes stop_codon:yes gene_type:complete
MNSSLEVLNFRYKPREFGGWDYPPYIDKSLLNLLPSVCKFFGTSIYWGKITHQSDASNHVLCHSKAKSLRTLRNNIKNISTGGVLVVGGADEKLSKVLHIVEEVSAHFSDVYFEAKNVSHDSIKAFPMGVNFAYFLQAGGDKVLETINNPYPKEKLIGAAWGHHWPKLDKAHPARKKLIKFCENNDWVQRSWWKPTEYFENLSRYKFFFCPQGAGVQCPKLYEALLVRSVPVVLNIPAHQDLVSQGFPFFLVDSWDDVTLDSLGSFYKDKCKDINWDNIIHNLSIEGFSQKYLL